MVRRLLAATVFVLIPASAAFAQPYAYVLGRTDTTPQKVTVINTKTDAVVTVITAGIGCECPGPDKIAALPNGARVYVANELDGTITVIDTSTNTALAPITSNLTVPTAVAVHPDGTKLYVLNGLGSLSVSIYSTASHLFLGSIPLPDATATAARGMTASPDGTRLYVSTYTSNKIKVIDTGSNTVLTTVTGSLNMPFGMDATPDGSKLYVMNYVAGGVSVLDTATNMFTGGFISTGSGEAVRVGPDGTRAYAPSYGSQLKVINTATDLIAGTIPLPANNATRAVDVTPDGTRVYLATDATFSTTDPIQVVSTATNTIVNSISLTEATNAKPGGIVITGSVFPPMADFNGDKAGDAFIYSPSSGAWALANTDAAGGFTATNGAWGPGWSLSRARFNGDALTDMFLFNASSGQWFKMLNDGAGGWTVDGFAAWGTNWQRFVVDLNGDGVSDVFLWDPALGTWFKCISTPGGFTYTQGFWSLGWEVYPMRLNADAFADFFIFNRSSGQWFWVAGEAGPGFTYPQFASWSPVWQFYPGDFTGDGLSDLVLHNPANGQYFIATNSGTNFGYVFGIFGIGLSIYPMDLNADGRTDLFLHNGSTGQWFEQISLGTGTFLNGGSGGFSTGWTIYPTELTGDGRGDLLLYNPATGQWFQARNFGLGTFSYVGGTWATGLTIVTGSMR